MSAIPNLIVELEKRVEAGDKTAILEAINWCIRFRIPIPDPIAYAFKYAVVKMHHFEIDLWDEVFGKPNKHKKRHAQKQEKEIGWSVYWQVEQLRCDKITWEAAFTRVGKNFGIDPSRAKRLYHAMKKQTGKEDQGSRIKPVQNFPRIMNRT